MAGATLIESWWNDSLLSLSNTIFHRIYNSLENVVEVSQDVGPPVCHSHETSSLTYLTLIHHTLY